MNVELAIPNLHPAVVHFPIVLIPLALALDVGALWATGLRRAGAAAWTAAALATTAAFLAGRSAGDSLVDLPAVVQPALGDHATWAAWTLGTVWAITVVRLVAEGGAGRPWAPILRGLVVLGGLGLGGLLFGTAERGGGLVYQHAVAVTVPPCPACGEVPDDAAPGALTLTEVDGTWTWTPQRADLQASGLDMWPRRGLAVSVEGTHQWLLPPMLGDVQLNVWLDLTRFDGEVGLLHHVVGDTGGAFFVATTGNARLADRASAKVLDKGATEAHGRVALAISAAGSHLKGLVDGKVVAHGHAPALPDGQVGLSLRGEGLVAIEKLEVIRLQPQ